MSDNPVKLALVYQGGIANVFAVKYPHGRRLNESWRFGVRTSCVRVMQSSFYACASFCAGAHYAGAKVVTFACNHAGDIARLDWDTDLELAPFSDKITKIY